MSHIFRLTEEKGSASITVCSVSIFFSQLTFTGSYGSPPRPVIEAGRAISDEIEDFPDRFMRRSWLPRLNKVRQQTASLIGAQQSDIVIVPNVTVAISTILYNINWVEGDLIVICTAIPADPFTYR